MSKEREVLLKMAGELYYSDSNFSTENILFILKQINFRVLKNPVTMDTLYAIVVEATTK